MRKLAIIGSTVASVGVLVAGTAGVVGATSSTASKNPNVGQSGIPKTVYKTERLASEASVLHTTSDKITASHKDHSMKTLVSAAGLTSKTYHQQVKAALTSDLEGKGYSAQQVTIAMQRKQINHLKHHDKKLTKSTSTTTN